MKLCHGWWRTERMLDAALLLLFVSSSLHAQVLRDPTVAPAVGGSKQAVAGEDLPAFGDINVVVRDGKPHLLVDGLLLAEGSRLQGLRIERIGETEVWLRSGKRVLKLPRFPGVSVKPVR